MSSLSFFYRLHKISQWKSELREWACLNNKTGSVSDSTSGKIEGDPSTLLKTILHVDVDCFFAQAALLSRPELVSFPVAVAHGQGNQGFKGVSSNSSTSEIASCNYPARKFGIQNGMMVGVAQDKLPPGVQLHVLSYDFPLFEAISKKLYHIFLSQVNDSQYVGQGLEAISLDEAYLDFSCKISSRGSQQEVQLGKDLQALILKLTKLNVSIGIGESRLTARLANRIAKPNGVHWMGPEGLEKELDLLPVRNLPGVGHKLEVKLSKKEIFTCQDLRKVSKRDLKSLFGDKCGLMLWESCRGIDGRELKNEERSSIGAEVNWGVRFSTLDQVRVSFSTFFSFQLQLKIGTGSIYLQSFLSLSSILL